MKLNNNYNIILYFILSIFLSCKSVNHTNNKSIFLLNENSYSPKDANFFVKVIQNKSVTIQKDKFDKSFITFEENKSSTVLKFSYIPHKIDGIADAEYREEVYLTIKNNHKEVILSDQSLSDVNAIFGRLCFCRESSGYFPLEKGKLEITKTKNKAYKLEFTFKIHELPQILKSISATIVF